jgi:DNA-binding CsgD family transcriptional regulator
VPDHLPGRQPEQDAIAALLARAAAGDGGALLLHGELGIGKTALLDAAAARAGGFLVVSLAAGEAESGIPAAMLHRLLDAIPGPDPGVALDRDAFAVSTAVLRLLRRAAQDRPVLCCVDDAHWLDPPSFAVLTLVARRLRGERIAMLLATGGDRVAGIPDLRIGPLDRRAGRAVLHGLVPTAEVGGVLASVAMGNPAALVELAAALTPEQLRGDVPLPRTLPAESRLRRAHRARLLRLPDETRGLLLLAAADDEADLDTLARAAAASGLDIGALEAAEAAGLVRVEDGRLGFLPPLLRGIAYHESTFARRRSVHAALAAAVDPHADPLRHHLHRALSVTGPDDPLAARLAAAAAGDAGRADAASRAYERAAELSGDPAAAASHLIAAARQAWRGGEPHRARVLLRRVRLMAVPIRLKAESEVLHGEIELRVGATSLARYTLLAAAEQAVPHDRDLAITALMRAGEALCISGDYHRFPALAGQVSALRRPGETAAVEFMGEHFATLAATFRGDHRAAGASLRRVVTLAPQLDAGALVHASLAALLCGADAVGLAVRAAAIARVNRDLVTGARAMDLVALAEFAAGRYDNPASALEALDLAREGGQENLVSGQYATLALLAAMVGDRATCLRRVRAAKAHLTPHNARRVRAVTNWALAVLDLGDGNYEDALARLLSGAASRGGHLLVRVAATPYLVEAAVRLDARRTAAAAMKAFDAWSRAGGNPRWLALAARCRALLAERPAEAGEHFGEALRQHALSGSELDRARTELLYGQSLRRARQPAAARAHLRGAWETFERFDAGIWAEQAAGELRAAGQHVEQREAPSTEALTPQQAAIARLVAAGATNREIAAHLVLSIRTIDHHLRNIFVKLGVRSRVELSRLIS